MNKTRIVSILLFILLLIWNLGIFSPALKFISNNIIQAIPFLKISYSKVCHQIPEKSMTINSSYILVCSRCTGIYIGALLTSLIMILLNLSKNKSTIKLFLFSSLLMLLDVISYNLGIYGYSKTIAFSTGFLLGSVVILYIREGILLFLLELERKNN